MILNQPKRIQKLAATIAVLPLTLLGVVGCSSGESNSGAAREASGGSEKIICLNNQTSGPLGVDPLNANESGGNTSIIGKGSSQCFTQSPDASERIALSMTGASGPSGWLVGLKSKAIGSGFSTVPFACDEYITRQPATLDCNGNSYQISADWQLGSEKFNVTIAVG